MRVGVPTEIKEAEYRVALTPAGVRELTDAGHEVLVQEGAGEGSFLPDADYVSAGARMVPQADDVWGAAELLLKVKEPIQPEFGYLRGDLTLFTYLHLAAERALTEALAKTKTTALAYETVDDPYGGLPLLAPMSEVAGRMSAQVGAHELERPRGGRGVLMGGVTGVHPARVVVVGAGRAGRSAAVVAAGMGAHVSILDLIPQKLAEMDTLGVGRITGLTSNRLTLEEEVAQADVLIGAVLVPGARAPRVITEDMVRSMRSGAVLVDISIDQGGCAETSHVTTHTEPTYVTHGVVHYCVGNMPGALPRTSTFALTNATIGFVRAVAAYGARGAAARDPHLAKGVNVVGGAVTEPGVAAAHDMEHVALERIWEDVTV